MNDIGTIPPVAEDDGEQEFDVSWETTVTARTRQEAARKAASLLGQVDPHKQVYDVRPNPEDGYSWEQVDLAREGS